MYTSPLSPKHFPMFTYNDDKFEVDGKHEGKIRPSNVESERRLPQASKRPCYMRVGNEFGSKHSNPQFSEKT